mmetsp:Transcript_53806/g.60112  ORF Transcript_53806/g.60112 Transcript_53806/m.60112 type:complete len:361 (-) Transcript_53806:150-1232(-)|eukprot:CAMPEP_0170991036 /NCGR_PEP_ID=MMETSP0736-20130129/8866_1 /TAXON_ID=186038 /ORGANISM="Fragilariopsis kerguelensis, Strain L26-C5" /LENGTH=360 /DNA_ID=CAMNT_0011416141 /DNA_START=42 /DNA_END=1124 /DNA_ORIENTATION=-
MDHLTIKLLAGMVVISQGYQYPSDRLLDLLSNARQQKNAMQIVGVHDALSANIVQHQYELQLLKQQKENGDVSNAAAMGLFVSGFGVSASRIAQPDMSILSRYEIEDTARNIIQAVSSSSSSLPPPPVIVDGDTGFGGTANVRETIRRIASLKAAAITIEDQCFPKKCTYIAGSSVNIVSRTDAINRMGCALAAQKEAEEIDGNRMLIVGRTDCRMAFGLDEAIERCLAFQELGADIIYAENLQSKEEYLALRKAMVGGDDVATSSSSIAPMILAQFQTGEKNQRLYSVNEVSSMGYEMTLYGVTSLQATVSALQSVASELFNNDDNGSCISTPLSSLNEIKEVVGFPDLDLFEKKYGCI